jgi:cysteine synthase
MKIAQNIGDLIGNTPIIKLKSGIYGKCEFMNPTSSVKDRIGFNMIKQSIKDGTITKDTNIIEPTSGNTGIALASQCASLGLKLTLTMPDSMSMERRNLLKALGANLILTPKEDGMNGAIKKANDICKENKNSIVLQQFENHYNPSIHETTTAIEILNDMDKNIDIFVASVGTGGTLSGTAKVLKQELPNIKIVGVEPINSAVISGEKAGQHQIQGIGAGFIPKNLDIDLIDEVIKVSDEDAIKTARILAKNEGLLVGISSGANVYVSEQLRKKDEYKNKNIVTILCDTGERYLSSGLYDYK